MPLSISAGRILMTDGSGNVRFDTNEKLFIPTDYKTGSYTLPSYSCRSQWDGANASSHTDTITVNQDNTYTLTSINSSATTVRGAFKVSVSYGLSSVSSWYNASGSYVHMWQGGAYGSPTLSCGARDVCAVAVYTFFCDSGSLKLREQVKMVNEPGYCLTGANVHNLAMTGPTIDYKLFCGAFV